jgi:hypothetical protein
MPRMAVKAGHDLIDVIVAGPARGRKESDGQTNDDREKGLVHDRASILLGEEVVTKKARIPARVLVAVDALCTIGT